MPLRPTARLSLTLAAALLAAGCPAPAPTTPSAAPSGTPASAAPTAAPLALAGMVTFRGEPMKNATLALFDARSGEKAPDGRLVGGAATGADGRFSLSLVGAAPGEVYRLVAGSGSSTALAGTFLVTEAGVRALSASTALTAFRLLQAASVNLSLDEATTALSIAAGGPLRLGASLTPAGARAGVEDFFAKLEATAPELTKAFVSQATAASRVAQAIDPATGWLKTTAAGESALAGLMPRAGLEAAVRAVLTAYSEAAKDAGKRQAGAPGEASAPLVGLGATASWGADAAVAVRRADGTVKPISASDAFSSGSSGGGSSSGSNNNNNNNLSYFIYTDIAYDASGNAWVARYDVLNGAQSAVIRHPASGGDTVVALPAGSRPLSLKVSSTGDVWVADDAGAVHCVRASQSSSSPAVLTWLAGPELTPSISPSGMRGTDVAVHGDTAWVTLYSYDISSLPSTTTTARVACIKLNGGALSEDTDGSFDLPELSGFASSGSYLSIAYDENPNGPDIWVAGTKYNLGSSAEGILYGREEDPQSATQPVSHSFGSGNALNAAIAVTGDHAVWLTSLPYGSSTTAGKLYRVAYDGTFSVVSKEADQNVGFGDVQALGNNGVLVGQSVYWTDPTSTSTPPPAPPPLRFASFDSNASQITSSEDAYALDTALPSTGLISGVVGSARFSVLPGSTSETWKLAYTMLGLVLSGSSFGTRILTEQPG